MTYLRDVFSDYVQLKTPKIVKTANNGLVYGFGIGNVHVQVFTDDLRVETLILTDVLYVPDLASNLISVSQLQEKGTLVQTAAGQKHLMVLTRNGSTVAFAARIGSQYILDSVATEATMAAADGGVPNLDLWHRRFGHIGVQGLRGLHGAVSDLGAPITVPRGHNSDQCEPCIMAK
jgi:hypothetical protein